MGASHPSPKSGSPRGTTDISVLYTAIHRANLNSTLSANNIIQRYSTNHSNKTSVTNTRVFMTFHPKPTCSLLCTSRFNAQITPAPNHTSKVRIGNMVTWMDRSIGPRSPSIQNPYHSLSAWTTQYMVNVQDSQVPKSSTGEDHPFKIAYHGLSAQTTQYMVNMQKYRVPKSSTGDNRKGDFALVSVVASHWGAMRDPIPRSDGQVVCYTTDDRYEKCFLLHVVLVLSVLLCSIIRTEQDTPRLFISAVRTLRVTCHRYNREITKRWPEQLDHAPEETRTPNQGQGVPSQRQDPVLMTRPNWPETNTQIYQTNKG